VAVSWQNLVLEIPGDQAKDLAELLESLGASSVTLADAGDEPLLEPAPGATPIWDRVRVMALFAPQLDVPALISRADASLRERDQGGMPPWRIEPLHEREWTAAWREHLAPLTFWGRLRVLPADPPRSPRTELGIAAGSGGETDNARPAREAVEAFRGAIVRLSPGLAFGTGSHPTTRLCLQRLARHPPVARRVTDFGCGSGILALAALALGARAALAIDHDPQALRAARANAGLNACAAALTVTGDAALPAAGSDLLLANVLAGPLIERAEAFDAHLAPGGELVLSGILAEQVDAVREAYPRFRFEVGIEDGWACLHGRRREDRGACG